MLLTPPPPQQTVTARGHIKALRLFKKVAFMDLSDGSGHRNLNVVVQQPERVLDSGRFRVGQSVEVTGLWTESQGTQGHELQYDDTDENHALKILGDVASTYPIQKKSQSLQFLRTVPTLRHRTSLLASVLRFRSRLEGDLMRFFDNQGFFKVTPPLITASDCEGAGEQFQVDQLARQSPQQPAFFGKDAYLTVSTQLHLEVLALSMNRVWTLTPCFRAEHSNTNRHLSEFWMLEAEMCYVDEVAHLTDFVEAMMRSVVSSLRQNALTDLCGARFAAADKSALLARWDSLTSTEKWPCISYSTAVDIINAVKCKGRLKGRLTWGDSILTDHEKWLAGTHFRSPVFITDYPASQKPFYMPPSKDYDPEKPTVACFDLIVPEMGELVGGSLREHNHNALVEQMHSRNMKTEDMQWYLSTRENGSVPHGGFGMGFERLVAYLAAIENIKDVAAFPRAPGVCTC